MESNKILIGICFYDNKTNKQYFIELLVLRDITLNSLYESIKWGLEKKKNEFPYDICKHIFDSVGKNIWIVNHVSKSGKIEPYQLKEKNYFEKICDLGFVSSTRMLFSSVPPNSDHFINPEIIIPAFNPSNNNTKLKFPEYNISSRQLTQLDNTPIDIISPSEPPKKSQQSIFMTILPMLLLMFVTIIIRSNLMSGSSSMIYLTVAMVGVTLLTTILNYVNQKREYKKNKKNWQINYTNYINNLISDIRNRQKKVKETLEELYPDVNKIINNIFSINDNIFSRSQNDDDFLSVRLGSSSLIESPFKINGNKKDVIFSSSIFTINKDNTVSISVNDDLENNSSNLDTVNYLSNLPNELSKRYQYLNGSAPLIVSLKNCGNLGIVDKDIFNAKKLVESITFELCYYHLPEDLQFIILFDEIEKKDPQRLDKIEECIKMYKYMPHFRDIFFNKSSFVFDKESASSIFSSLLELMNERNSKKADKLPHIVLIIYEEYGLKEHAFARYLPQPPESGKPYVDNLGITFIFVKRYKEHLPNYCSQIINITNESQDKIEGTITPRENLENCKPFSINENDTNLLCNSYELLSTLHYCKISQNSKVPSNVSIYELFGINGDATNNNLHQVLEKYWKYYGVLSEKDEKNKKDVTKSLAIPLGRTEDGITYLDLHEKGDGPHMLVAGTTGSGKSETIISYLLGLCLMFRPDEINLMLVDMKGEGFVGRIGSLPHVVGKVTDVDDDSGAGAEYMLKRFLNSLTAEIKRRKLLFKKLNVDSIDKYIWCCQNMEKHIDELPSDIKKDKNRIQEMINISKTDKLTHLILIVDEFTELKRFSNENSDIDFIGEITTIARVGRSLGIHIILISQNIEGAINDDIRVNCKSRLCLKVATRQASKEMIHTDLAASPTMPGNGRAYLLVGTGSKFEYFQSAYSGASASLDDEVPIKIIEANKVGDYTTFYDSKKDNKEQKEKQKLDKKTQLNVIVEAIKYYNENYNNDYKPHIVFQPPLPNKIVYDKNGQDKKWIEIDEKKSSIRNEE